MNHGCVAQPVVSITPIKPIHKFATKAVSLVESVSSESLRGGLHKSPITRRSKENRTNALNLLVPFIDIAVGLMLIDYYPPCMLQTMPYL